MAKSSWSKWTDKTVERFRAMYPNSTWDELLAEFPFSKSSMKSKACELGIARRNTYSEKEDSIIIRCARNGMSDREISEILTGRSISGIATRRQRLGIVNDSRWTCEENDRLRALYGTMPADKVSEYFPERSRNSIVSHATALGLRGYFDYHFYTEDEHEFIRQNYSSMSDSEMGAILGHPACSIKNRRNKLGCHRHDGSTKYEDISLYIRRHNEKWKADSMRQCNYKCVLSGERFDDIHHLVSQNSILRDVFLIRGIDADSFDINALNESERLEFLDVFYSEQAKHPLGICLTHNIHKQFHDEYGYGDNTPAQFNEFVKRFYPDRLSSIG